MTDLDSERRRKARYPVKDSSAVLLSPDNIISYSLLDISASGLAFTYNGPGTEVKIQSHGHVELFGEVMLVSDLKIKIISDSSLATDDICLREDVEGKIAFPYLRRCGVEFADLNQKQDEKIADWLKIFNGAKS